jgi:hypothetical protein
MSSIRPIGASFLNKTNVFSMNQIAKKSKIKIKKLESLILSHIWFLFVYFPEAPLYGSLYSNFMLIVLFDYIFHKTIAHEIHAKCVSRNHF